MKNPLFEQGGFDRLPAAFRGVLFSLSTYTEAPETIIKSFQRFVGANDTGLIDPETCEKAESMLQLKSGHEVLDELSTVLSEGQVNGIRYRASQYKTPKMAWGSKAKKIEHISFDKETYGETKYGTD